MKKKLNKITNKLNMNKEELKAEDFLVWTSISTKLSGSDNSIRRNTIRPKYEKKINMLIRLVNLWLKWVK